MDHFRLYLRTLYKIRRVVQLASACIRMHKVFPGSPLALEWLCKVYLEWCADAIETDECHTLDIKVFGSLVTPPISSYIQTLMTLNPASTLAKLASGANAFKCGIPDEAIFVITKTFSESPKSATNFYATFILCQSLEKMSDDIRCEEYSRKALMLLEEKVKGVIARTRLKEKLEEMLVTCLYRQMKLDDAVHIVKFKRESSTTALSYSTLILWAKIFANSGDRKSVEELMASMSNDVIVVFTCFFVRA